ncbi:APC family permease [[Mycoplasma] testudinis]|uniref:APC family permease n=1 Tax=[Mycoplasma] testudinis TaxID=33924 RepID=UPI0004821FA6|nr:APC family permease [[Mycoplasma] testudinis]
MNIQSARKIGFFTALTMALGSVVGIGIFLKNVSIVDFQAQGADAAGFSGTFSFWSMLITWILGAVITFLAALSFAEVSSSRISSSGLAGWSEQLVGKRFGRFVRFNHSLFYYVISMAVLPFLAVEGIYNALDLAVNGQVSGKVSFGYIFLGGIIVSVSFILLNVFSLKASGLFQNFTTVFKVIALSVVFIVGLIGVNQAHILDRPNLQNSDLLKLYESSVQENSASNFLTPSSSWISVQGIFVSFPAVFFSFDGYTNVGNLAKIAKNPQRTIPFVMIIAIIIASLIYIVISIGSGLTGFGDVGKILATLIPDSASNATFSRNALDIFIKFLVSISALGVVNGISFSAVKGFESLIEEGQIVGWRHLQTMNHKKVHSGTLLLLLLTVSFLSICVGVSGTILNTDSLVDSMTNIQVLLFFLVYASIIAAAFVDRFTKKQCHRVWGFWFAAPISSLAIFAVFVYMFFYQNIVLASQQPFSNSGAGLFFKNPDINNGWRVYQDAVVFWVLVVWFFTLPLINHLLVKKTGGYMHLDHYELNLKAK